MGLAWAILKSLVVVPTYNEADNIAKLLDALLAQELNFDVLVVDDSSVDGTDKIVLQFKDKYPNRIHLLSRPEKAGLGAAYVAGFKWAVEAGGYDGVVQMDADFSHDPKDAVRLVQGLEVADVCIGSRYVHGGGVIDWSLRREALSRWGNAYARLLLGVKVRDLTGGFKAWKIEVLEKLDWQDCSASGYGFQIQTTLQAMVNGASVLEIPIIFRDRTEGESKMHGGIITEALIGVVRLRRATRGKIVK